MDAEMPSSESGPALIKQLASCNQASRGHALRVLLKTWLPTQLTLSDDDMKKLWKGLFYCMWHSDKAPAQSHLIDRLSSLLHSLHLPLAVDYFSAFLLTMRREWSGIDALRLDKFYLLIRRFVSCWFGLMRSHSWDLEMVKRLMGVLMEGTFFASDKFPGKGVNYHIATVFLEELRAFMPVRKEVVEVLLVGFVGVMAKAEDKVLVGKVKGSVFDVLLVNGRKLLEGRRLGEEVGEGDEDVVVFGSVALCLGFSSRFHEMGESEECCQGNRKVLFGLGEEFLKLEKEVADSRIVIEIPDGVRNEDEEVSSLIPIEGDGMDVDKSELAEGTNGSAKKRLKKCKKSEKDPGGVKAEKKKKIKEKKKEKKEKENGVLNSDSETNHTDKENDNVAANGENPDNDQVTDEIKFNDDAISNLQVQFEKAAAEAGLDHDLPSACELLTATANGTVSNKRKRMKKADEEVVEDVKGKSGEKSAKKVKFSMKNNLVWKPQSPLPPQDLRLPPSATPRGSALKQGVPPGPIREMPPPTKKVKKVVKKARKVVKRVKKLKSRST